MVPFDGKCCLHLPQVDPGSPADYIFMHLARKWLPRREKNSLPARQVTGNILKLSRRLSERREKALPLFLHVALGTSAGILAVEEKIPGQPVLKGLMVVAHLIWGLAVSACDRMVNSGVISGL